MSNFEIIASILSKDLVQHVNPESIRESCKELDITFEDANKAFKTWSSIGIVSFLENIQIRHIRKILKPETQISLFNQTELRTDLPTQNFEIKEMDAGEIDSVKIEYEFLPTPYGQIIAASTPKGICYISFEEDQKIAVKKLKAQFSNSSLLHQKSIFSDVIPAVFNDEKISTPIKLHLKGTKFQLKVWKALTEIPRGRLKTYQDIAHAVESPKSARAVGAAVGRNLVAYLIPCHRVIRADGVLGGFMWGAARKKAMIGREIIETQK